MCLVALLAEKQSVLSQDTLQLECDAAAPGVDGGLRFVCPIHLTASGRIRL
jgi:hypothetical protein